MMKLTTFLILISIMQVSATALAQKISLSEKNTPLSRIFIKISEQSGYDFLVTGSLLKTTKPVSINVKNADFNDVLTAIFKDQPISFKLEDKVVVVSKREGPSFLDKLVDAFTPPIDVYGTVLDEKGSPLIGATIKVKGFQQSTTTDREGKFFLPGVDDKAVLVISFIGYAPKEVAAKASVSVSLEIQSAELQEVNVAYGKTTQQALTGSVTVVSGEQIQNLPNRSFDKSLQGLVPGLQITSGTGQPGGNTANFVLRGIATGADVSSGLTAANPLFVIDGVPVSQQSFTANPSRVTQLTNPLAQLNPSDIESITVLKDAAAIALYGAKSSNGVILVTTKKGKAGKTTFSFRSQTDLATRLAGKTAVLNQQDYLSLLYQTYKNTNATNWTDDKILADLKIKFPVRSDGSFYPEADWDDSVFEDNAFTTTNELSLSGGADKHTYFVNLEYLKQNGAVKATGYDRKSIRINLENKPTSFLKLGINSTFSYNLQQLSNGSAGTDGFGLANVISPLNPVKKENGEYILVYPFGTPSQAVNPVAQSEYNINSNTAYRGLANIYGELALLRSFTFRSLIGVDFMLAETKTKVSPVFSAASSSALLPNISDRDVKRNSLINSNTLSYNKTIANVHSINLLLGQESQINNQKDLAVDVRGTMATLDFYDQINSPGYTLNSYSGYGSKQTQLSWFAQGNYAFNSKYHLTASIRGDGSSRFGDDQRWGKFWSTGIGWVISNENFFKGKDRWLSFLKVRSSIGAAGNSSAIDAYTRFDRIGLIIYEGDQAVIPSIPGNPDIKWEATTTWDVGIEAKFLKNKISINADYYARKTADLIFSMNLPSTAGIASIVGNIGDIKNSGFEVQLSAEIIRLNSFSWNFAGNWSKNENILTKANVPLAQIYTGNIGREEGRNFNSYYIPIWAGVNQDTGRPQWLKADGTVTSTYSQAAKQFVGKPQPDGFGSILNTLRYKDLMLSISLYYQYGSKIFDDGSRTVFLNDGQSPYVNQSTQALNYWKKTGDIAPNPRRLLNNTDGGNRVSTRYLFDGDYLRIQNVAVNYNLAKRFISPIGLQSASIYVQGNNLATFTKYSGADPDNANFLGNTGFAYPNAKVFSVGINARF
ncbi:MAG: SusC/RagA family TonB-linked outer membrane protein [Bacteroidota bacterium]